MLRKLSSPLLVVGLLMVAAGILLPILTHDLASMTYRWIFTAGALLAVFARLTEAPVPPEVPLRLRRLVRLEKWSALLYLVGAGFAFYNAPQNPRDWFAFTLAGAAVQIYCTLMISLSNKRPKKP